MVATDTEVMGWVEKQLQDNPGVTVDELFEGAKILQPDVAELNKRQFHARYPLQVKRRAKRPRRRQPLLKLLRRLPRKPLPRPPRLRPRPRLLRRARRRRTPKS